MEDDFWGRYNKNQPQTHFDPLGTFIENDIPYGFRVNYLNNRDKRPREQHIKVPKSFIDQEIDEEEIQNSPLYRVLYGKEPCVPIAVENNIIGDPDDTETVRDFSEFSGITIMNKFAPLGIKSAKATGVALVNYPNQYTRTLDEPELIFNLFQPMRRSLQYLLSGNSYRDDLKTPLVFFNVGPGSGASIRYLHAQSYVVPNAMGLNTYGYKRAFDLYKECLACKIANDDVVVDKVNGDVNFDELVVWEDDNVRIIYPFAPMRSMATRIIPKHHVDYMGNMKNDMLRSLSNAISVADYLMNAATPPKRSVRKDRTIAFRQTSEIGKDFHMFVDILPPFPSVAAETVDFLGLSPLIPGNMAKQMRDISIDHLSIL